MMFIVSPSYLASSFRVLAAKQKSTRRILALSEDEFCRLQRSASDLGISALAKSREHIDATRDL